MRLSETWQANCYPVPESSGIRAAGNLPDTDFLRKAHASKELKTGKGARLVLEKQEMKLPNEPNYLL